MMLRIFPLLLLQIADQGLQINLSLKVYSTSDPNYVEWVLDIGNLVGRTSYPCSVRDWLIEIASNDSTLADALDSEFK